MTLGSSSLSDLERRILKFFLEQPQAVETVRGIAAWVGAPPEAVQGVLEDLVGRRWLLTDGVGAVRGYTLSRDSRLLEQMVRALETP